MKEKILERLTQAYSNLGLPKNILEFRADVLSKTVTEESQIEEAVKGENDFLKAIQAFGDKRASSKKGNDGGNKGDNDPKKDEPTDGDSDLKKLIEKQNQLIETLAGRVNELEGSSKKQSFDEKVAKIAKEMDLAGDMLELAKAKLSPDMDETAIRDSLGATKKIFINMGARFEGESGGKYISEEEAARKEAEEWVKANEVKE